MIKYLITLLTNLFVLSIFSFEQDDILGTWVTQEKRAHITITKRNNQYYGHISKIIKTFDNKNYNEVDVKNPDPSLRNNKILGVEIIKDFTYSDQNLWKNGTVYDPKTGKTYKANISMENNNTLNLRGFIGFSLLGRTTKWKRQK